MELTAQQESKIRLIASDLNLSPERVLALILAAGIEKFTLSPESDASQDFVAKVESLQRLVEASPNRFRTTQEIQDHIEGLRQGW